MIKSKLVSTCLVAAALMIPAVGYSQYGTPPASKDTAAPKKEGTSFLDDASISTKIKGEYAKDKDVSALRLNVDTDKGVVTLRGTAKSKEEADKAVSIAKGVSGVSSVKNEIKVESK